MGITGSIIVYVMIWWIIFFSVLPVGIRSNKEVFQEKIGGWILELQKSKIAKKFLITTLITTIIFQSYIILWILNF